MYHMTLSYDILVIPPTTFSGELQLSKGKASYLNVSNLKMTLSVILLLLQMSLALHSPTVKVQLSKEQVMIATIEGKL